MHQYDVGDRLRLTVEFRAIDTSALANPTLVTAQLYDPAGLITDVTTAFRSTGIWDAYVEPDQAGTWRYKFFGTGALVAAGEGAFSVRPSVFD